MEENQVFYNFDNISLEGLHTHLFFGNVDTNSAYNACNFILKSNLLYADATLNLVLNSTGGDCSEAFAVIDTMTCSRLPVFTTGIGSIMSMGVLMLSAEISGYAPTSRVKHRGVVNVPKADPKVLLGNEMRDLFTVEKGNWYCGTDASALENRTLSSYTYKYDGGDFARRQIEGDPHSFNAFSFFPHLHKTFDVANEENKENPQFKSWRNKAKTGAYLLAFGGGAPKLASSLGLSKKEGQVAFDNYWEQNKGLGLLKENVEKYFDTTGKKKYIPAIDGRIVSVRGKNVLLSCLGQGCGAIAMSYAACFMDTWLGEMFIDELGRPYYLLDGKRVKRISMVHDEFSWEVEDGVQEQIRELTVKSIIKAGEVLKLALPLNGEGKIAFEGSWKDVH
jgi:DNA polymerase I-like protein with 3'-5' exonuclease and polymerase domains